MHLDDGPLLIRFFDLRRNGEGWKNINGVTLEENAGGKQHQKESQNENLLFLIY